MTMHDLGTKHLRDDTQTHRVELVSANVPRIAEHSDTKTLPLEESGLLSKTKQGRFRCPGHVSRKFPRIALRAAQDPVLLVKESRDDVKDFHLPGDPIEHGEDGDCVKDQVDQCRDVRKQHTFRGTRHISAMDKEQIPEDAVEHEG